MSNFKQVGDRSLADINAANRDAHSQDAELKAGQKMRFNGRSVGGTVEGSMPVSVVNPHSNAAAVTHSKGGKEYEGAFTHIRQAIVERPAHKERPAKQFEAHHFTLSNEDKASDALTHPGGAGGEPPRLHHQREEDEAVADRAIHLPRNAQKRWKKGVGQISG
jgi:hypothetical protein